MARFMDREKIKRLAKIRPSQRDRDILEINEAIRGGRGPAPFLTPAGAASHAYMVTPTGCHEWQGQVVGETRGPMAWYAGKVTSVRRHVYRTAFPSRPIDKLDIVTTCDNHLCINPDHLASRLRSLRKRGYTHGIARLLSARGVDPRAYEIDEKTGCHIWRHRVSEIGGSPTASLGERKVLVRRWLYRRLTGIEPPESMPQPNCGNRRCINPAHFIPKSLIRTLPKKPSWKGPQWQPWEDDYLHEHRHLADKQLAAELERPRGSVSARKLKLRLTHTRQACIDCGKLRAIRPGARCSVCAKNHRSEWRRQYAVRYHEEKRPSPTPIPQRTSGLPPVGELVYSVDGSGVQCHICGKFLSTLVQHVRVHSHNADTYKAAFGLGRTWSLLSPATAEKFRQVAIARDQGKVGRDALAELAPSSGRPKGLDNRLSSKVRSSQSAKGKPKNR